jgi:hypothetical protein
LKGEIAHARRTLSRQLPVAQEAGVSKASEREAVIGWLMEMLREERLRQKLSLNSDPDFARE